MAQDYLSTLASLPYPAVRVEGRNPAYARVMLGNIGDQNSETTCFALYLYNQTITLAQPEISAAFQAVAETERKHLELLGSAAFQLGADPRMWAVTGNVTQPMRYWSPGMFSYTANLRAMLQNALTLERATIAKYERQIQEIRDDGVLLLLRRILLDESMHVEIFRALLSAVDAQAVAQIPITAQAAPLQLPAVAVAPAPAAQMPAAVAQPVAVAPPVPQSPQALDVSQQGLPPQAQM